MARLLDTATVRIEADSRRGERDARRTGETFGREFTQGADSRLRDARGRFAQAGEEAGDSFGQGFKRGSDGRLRDARGRFVSKAEMARLGLSAGQDFGGGFSRQVRQQVREVERTVRGRVRTELDLEPGTRARLANRVRAIARSIRERVQIGVDVDRRGNVLTRLFSRIGSLAAKMGSAISSAVSTGVSGLQSMVSAAASGALSLGKMVGVAALLTPALAGVAGLATSAAGAIAAGFGGLPVLLTGIAAPIAAVAVGFEGIQKAAETIRPELDRIKASASAALERGMLVAFEALRPVLPVIEKGLERVSLALGSFLALLAVDLRSTEGLASIENALDGVVVMMERASGGIRNLIGELLDIAGVVDLYRILGITIGGVSLQIGQMLDRMLDTGDLQEGLSNLGILIFNLVDLVAALLEGSLKFFNAAAPGLDSFLSGLADALGRVDWAGLGEIFGGMLERLGAALEAIPPETWERLGAAIVQLADYLLGLIESGALDTLLNWFAKAIEVLPGVIDFVLTLAGAIGWAAEKVIGLGEAISGSGMFDLLADVGEAFWNLGRTIKDAVLDFMDWLGISSPSTRFRDIGIGILDGLLGGLAAGPRRIVDKLGEIKDAALQKMSDAKDWLVGLGEDLVMGFIRGIGSKIGEAARKAADMAKAAYNAAKAALGISSPSRLFASVGRDTVAGYLAGLRERIAPMMAQVRAMFAQAAQVALRSSRERMVQAEDGSWVPESFYTGGVRRSVGAGLNTGTDPQVLAAAFAAAMGGVRLAFVGPSVVEIVNDGNRKLGRR